MQPLQYPHDLETVAGNGRLIARVRAASAEFVFAGPADGYRLRLDGAPPDSAVTTEVLPGRTRYVIAGRGSVTVAAKPDAALLAVLVEGAADAPPADWSLELTGEQVDADAAGVETARGGARVWTPDDEAPAAERVDASRGALAVTLEPGGRAAFLLGEESAVVAFAGDPFEAAETWAEQSAQQGLRLRTPEADLDRAVEFAKAHLHLGYDWRPDAEGRPGGEGSKMVCDIFRWRDVWSRDFGSGFGPGGLAAGMTDAVLATLEYEAARHRAHDPAGLKISDDTSQGGSAEGLGWVLALVWRVFGHTGDLAWLERMADAFEPWVEEWVARDADDDGLVADVTEWMDHSRFLRLVEGQRTLYSNVLYAAALRRMAYITGALDRPDAAERYSALAVRSRQSVARTFWNEGGYLNNAVQWGVPDTALMLADNAIAIVEGVVEPDRQRRALATIRERSWRPFGTVTTDLPMRYVPRDNDHNGKVWPWWMAHEAKARFLNADGEGGLHVLRKIVDTFSWPTLPGLCEEYLDPEDGSQDEVVGHAFITGSGALLDAVQHGLVGLSVREPGERCVRLAPAAPESWDEWSAEIDLVEGRLTFEQSAAGYRVELAEARVQTLEFRLPPRATAVHARVDGEEVEPRRVEDAGSTYLRIDVPTGGRHVVAVALDRQPAAARTTSAAMPPPVPVRQAFLLSEPGLSPPSQDDVQRAEAVTGPVAPASADAIETLDGAGDLLVISGNELPYRTKGGASVPHHLEAYLGRGGSVLLLGPRFAPIDITAYYHGGAQMGAYAGLFWWKLWDDGQWVDYAPRQEERRTHPVHDGTVYWGDGPLFAAWEHGLGLFGLAAPCRGVTDPSGTVVDADCPVAVIYTDWTVRKPWSFTPLAFTERERQLVTGPRPERYPCAARLDNAESGGRILVVAPALCARADLLEPVLRQAIASAP